METPEKISSEEAGTLKPRNAPKSLFDPAIIRRASVDAFRKLDPRLVAKNPVMFVVEVGSLITTLYWFKALATHKEALFVGQVTLWLWFTVLFANFAEAMAEGRGKAQADTLRKAKSETMARKLTDGKIASTREELVPGTALRKGDLVVCEATFASADADLARRYHHLTAADAARIARDAGARRLVITHFSQRYPDVRVLLDEALAVFDDVVAAEDLLRVPVPERRRVASS